MMQPYAMMKIHLTLDRRSPESLLHPSFHSLLLEVTGGSLLGYHVAPPCGLFYKWTLNQQFGCVAIWR